MDQTASVSLIELHPAILLGIASYLDPDEIVDYFASCRTLRSVPSTCSDDAVFAARLGSVLGYFSVLRVYADMVVGSVEGGWPAVVRFLTYVSRRLRRLYGSFQVPLLHRALLGELTLGRMCSDGESLLCFAELSPQGDDDRYRESDDDFRANLYLPPVDSQQRPSFRQCFAEDPDYDGEVYGHMLRPFVFLGDIDSTFNRHSRTELGNWLKRIQSEVDREGTEPPSWLGPNRIARIRQGLLPVVWIFNRTSTEPQENRIGFLVPEDDDSGLTVCDWSREEPEDHPEECPGSDSEVDTMQCCQVPWVGRTRSMVEYFCTEVESHIYGLSVDHKPTHIDQLQRFAWLRAHRIPPFDIAGSDNVRYWEDVINMQEQETERAPHMARTLRMSWERFLLSETCRFARAALRGKVPLAVASDYT